MSEREVGKGISPDNKDGKVKPEVWTPESLEEYLRGKHDLKMPDSKGYDPKESQVYPPGKKKKGGRIFSSPDRRKSN